MINYLFKFILLLKRLFIYQIILLKNLKYLLLSLDIFINLLSCLFLSQ
jgi:hypothetical protein